MITDIGRRQYPTHQDIKIAKELHESGTLKADVLAALIRLWLYGIGLEMTP